MSIDRFIVEFDKALRAVFAPAPTRRPVPGSDVPMPELFPEERRHAAALMRVNHCGEICAQALYQGQALTSRDFGDQAGAGTCGLGGDGAPCMDRAADSGVGRA